MPQKNNNIIPSENNGKVVRIDSMLFSGPLPPPTILQQYEDVVPGAAKIIIEMAQKQSDHRQFLEKNVITSDIKKSYIGQIFAFILGLFGLAMGTVLIYAGKSVAGTALSGGTLLALVGVFIYGSSARKKERAEKTEETENK
jgi:uncharacterized membrane protein